MVQSPLGKPFRASIQVLDAPKDIQPECFSFRGGSDASLPGVTKADLRLETRDGNTTLFVTTRASIDDPIFQVTLSAGCTDRLEREYVVLLDPPLAHEPATVLSETLIANAEPPRLEQKRVRGPRSRNAHPRVRSAKVASRQPIGEPQVQATSTRSSVAKPVGSYLVLSGGRYRPDNTLATAVSLSSDKAEPDSSRSRSHSALSPTELSDERTSLDHRIAHLQAQLIALQKQNNELEAARSRHVQALTQRPLPDEKSTTPWTRFLIGLGILSGSMALFFGVRSPARSNAMGTLPERQVASPSLVTVGDTSLEHPRAPALFPQSLSEYGTEVNESILDQAEVCVAHGHASLAIHILQEYVQESPTESPVPWLLLLDLLTREGPEAEYIEACKACKKYYNINLSAGLAVAATSGSASLEAYPHVIAQLQRLWGYREAVDFLAELVYDRRDGTRLGFDSEAYREIMLLRSIAEETVYDPNMAPAPLSIVASTPPENQDPIDIVNPDSAQLVAAPECACGAERIVGSDAAAASSQPRPNVPTMIEEDLLGQAEWDIAQEQADLAIPLLQQRLHEAPTVSPVPWLLLLDLLARAGLHTEYQAASRECQSLFNVNLSAPTAVANTPGDASLEAYPHVLAQLQAVWGTSDAEYFLSNLVYDHRGGVRQGFDLGAYREILLLSTLAEEYS